MQLVLLFLSLAITFTIVLVLSLIYYNGKAINNKSDTVRTIRVHANEFVELIQSTWCKRILGEFSGTCCHLFDFIKKTQGSDEWGRILDAGTGSHSLDWLLSLPNKGITAVTGDPKRQEFLENEFQNKLHHQDRIITGNWKDPKFLEGETFDTVVADYLLGSVDAFAPYYQDKLFERIKSHVAKRLYVVGAEPLPDRADGNIHGQMIIEIAKLRDACILLAGDRPYREYPLNWVINNLKSTGYSIKAVSFFETTYNQDFVETQLNVAESKLGRIKNDDVAEAMQKHIDKLRKRVHRLSWGIKFGSDYVVVAERFGNGSKNKEESQIKGHRSLVLEQDDIFPIDEK